MTLEVYVVCLASYNNGEAHGEWVDANVDASDLQDSINEILEASPVKDAEEFAIHDYEGFGDYDRQLGEYPSLKEVTEAAAFIFEHDELGQAVLCDTCNVEDAEKLLENYYGTYDSDADLARHIVEESDLVPEPLQCYIDWEKMGRDYSMDFHEVETENGTAYFHH